MKAAPNPAEKSIPCSLEHWASLPTATVSSFSVGGNLYASTGSALLKVSGGAGEALISVSGGYGEALNAGTDPGDGSLLVAEKGRLLRYRVRSPEPTLTVLQSGDLGLPPNYHRILASRTHLYFPGTPTLSMTYDITPTDFDLSPADSIPEPVTGITPTSVVTSSSATHASHAPGFTATAKGKMITLTTAEGMHSATLDSEISCIAVSPTGSVAAGLWGRSGPPAIALFDGRLDRLPSPPLEARTSDVRSVAFLGERVVVGLGDGSVACDGTKWQLGSTEVKLHVISLPPPPSSSESASGAALACLSSPAVLATAAEPPAAAIVTMQPEPTLTTMYVPDGVSSLTPLTPTIFASLASGRLSLCTLSHYTPRTAPLSTEVAGGRLLAAIGGGYAVVGNAGGVTLLRGDEVEDEWRTPKGHHGCTALCSCAFKDGGCGFAATFLFGGGSTTASSVLSIFSVEKGKIIPLRTVDLKVEMGVQVMESPSPSTFVLCSEAIKVITLTDDAFKVNVVNTPSRNTVLAVSPGPRGLVAISELLHGVAVYAVEPPALAGLDDGVPLHATSLCWVKETLWAVDMARNRLRSWSLVPNDMPSEPDDGNWSENVSSTNPSNPLPEVFARNSKAVGTSLPYRLLPSVNFDCGRWFDGNSERVSHVAYVSDNQIAVVGNSGGVVVVKCTDVALRGDYKAEGGIVDLDKYPHPDLIPLLL